MASVETVRGPVELGNLGQTLMHEHIFVVSTEHVQNYGSTWWDEEARVADAIVKLNALYAKGIHTIVDPTVWGLGRYIPRIQRIAAGGTPVSRSHRHASIAVLPPPRIVNPLGWAASPTRSLTGITRAPDPIPNGGA